MIGRGQGFSLAAMVWLAWLAASTSLPAAAQQTTNAVELFSPSGSIKQVRQVTARFTTAMVALGDPRLPDPFTIDCAAPGKGRWADTRNWIYDFDEDLPAGIRCTFSLLPELRAVNGDAIAGERTFTFDTGGPSIVASIPYESWTRLDEEQIFLLKLDAPATTQSIQANAHCIVDGVSEQIPVEVLSGERRAAVLRERKALGYDYYEFLWKSGRSSQARVRNRNLEVAEARIVVLQCERRLPAATRVLVHWGAGIKTTSGIATTQPQQLAFRVRPAFTAQVGCTRANARSGCMPMHPITVTFTAPLARELAMKIALRVADGSSLQPDKVSDDTPHVEGVTFAGPFPEGQPATVVLPNGLVDDAGRVLENAARFPLQVDVDEAPPLAKFSGAFGILEANEGGILPVTLRNLEPGVVARQAALPAKVLRLENDPSAVADWLRRVEKAGEERGEWATAEVEVDTADQNIEPGEESWRRRSVWREMTGSDSVFKTTDATTEFTVKKPAGPKPAEVVGIPLKDPGFYVVEIESRALGKSLLGRDASRYVATAALVTNLAVHFKWGREASVAWVTRLDNGMPVPDAQISVIDYCAGTALWNGVTDKDGIATISETFGEPHSYPGCVSYAPAPLLIAAKQGAQFSFTQTGWAKGINPSQFGVATGNVDAAKIYTTVLDRALFRSGETVAMKHFVRQHDIDGMSLTDGLPATYNVDIHHQGSGQRYTLETNIGADGIGETTWQIPAEAKLGDYGITLSKGRNSWQSGRFKVEQFRLPAMRASVVTPAVPLVRPKSVDLDLHVAYMSGGGAGNLPVKLRTVVEPRPVQFAGFGDYQFGGAPVVAGMSSNAGTPDDFDFEREESAQSAKAQVLPVTLDSEGSARVTIPNLPTLDGPAQLTAELEYADANGELLTTSSRVRLIPSMLSVGIRRDGWVASQEQLRFRILVVDAQGKPRSQQPVSVALYQAQSYSYRKRLIGGFYAYETNRETRKLAPTCKGTTDANGLVLCEVAPNVSGEVLVRAETRDTEGFVSGATTSFWVVGKDSWWFGGTTGDRMDLLPEKKEYEAGDSARFQVRMPFREATALVTVEREGVMSSFVTHLEGEAPIVEVPIANNYSPNVFVSVLAVRGRVANAQKKRSKQAQVEEITTLVDLNKPAYRLGVAAIKVGWKPHRLDVRVVPQQTTYQVRDKAQVQIHVSRADGGALPAGTEIAVAAVDEALLSLAPNPSWDLLKTMMGERGLEVWTSTAQMQVVGKRHYGRKAVVNGGGGGRERDRARELFDSLLYWKARVTLDGQGNASVQVPLNDSLSSFRIVAIANGAAHLFGTGSASINTTQDLILLSGLPPLVREADRFAATFTVRNTTERAVTVEANATLTPKPAKALAVQRMEIPAGQSRDLVWQVQAPIDTPNTQWQLTVRDVNGNARDTLKITQAVIPAYPVRTYQATIAQLTSPLSIPAALPKGAIPGRGGLEIALRAKLGDGLDSVREFMQRYPYTCLEQQLSQAVALRNHEYWQALMERLPAYMDHDGLLKYFPTEQIDGDDSLSAYVLMLAHEAGWQLLDADRDRVTDALRRFVSGKLVRRSALPTADLTFRKLAAIEALSRYGLAQPEMLDSITIEPNLWPTSAVLDWLGIMKRVPGIADLAERETQALGVLRSRLNFQSTVMTFSTERSDALWWLMISADSNANRMLLTVLDRPEWREDIPRLVRGALSRQQWGHWNTTVANAWGVVAMEKFSAAFESEPVSGQSSVRYGADSRDITWTATRNTEQVELPWQTGQVQLDVAHSGTGNPWVTVRATAALPLDKPLSTGFKITRTVTPVDQKVPGRWSRADVARVRLELESQTDMSWVVVDDPIPAGASILGSGLGGQSELLNRGNRTEGWAYLAFQERRFDSFRSYYSFVPKGRWVVEYTVRLNNPGQFQLPATRVEAMYAPEMLGETPNDNVVVESSP